MSQELSIKQNSLGDFECPICKKAFLTRSEAAECWQEHKEMDATDDVREVVSRANSDLMTSEFKSQLKSGDTLGASTELVAAMIEDYLVARQNDMIEKGKVSSLTLQLAKNAAAALNDHNKLVYGEKKTSVSASMHVDQKDSLEAFKDLLTNKREPKAPETMNMSDMDKKIEKMHQESLKLVDAEYSSEDSSDGTE